MNAKHVKENKILLWRNPPLPAQSPPVSRRQLASSSLTRGEYPVLKENEMTQILYKATLSCGVGEAILNPGLMPLLASIFPRD